ncbi:glycosyltransferase family 4 protein [Rossellomorea marisflavi]|uniref:glycosyltransferase family 4 protein n=1 Tax=Rossellomorea marisflavi TaxID=189381 RepID=UPI0025B0C5A2|nr:glycosyltransferase family 4 protein [Rossellomorea marisflavi]WJV19352.1 glycosyltransferase family 4 protein [Rossellomorea marisflavi]
MKKKVIVVYLTGMQPSGGKERVVSNLLKEWYKNYEIILITKDSGNSFYEIPSDIKKITLNTPFLTSMKKNRFSRIISTYLNLFFSIYKLKKTLSRLDFDYIYVTSPLNAFETFYAIKDAKEKLVISEHASINAFNRIYSWMKKHVYPKSYCISVPNSRDTEIYKTWGCNALFIPHLVTYIPVKKNNLDTKIVLNVGRLTSDKQQGKLIEIWSKLKNKGSWRLWIVGDGEEHDRLLSIINEKGLHNSVELLPARKDIQKLYRQASLFAFSSRTEGFGMVLLEAMSFGIPCISFDCPSGPIDIVQDNINGCLIEDGNTKQFINSLDNLLAMSSTELSYLGDNAFKTVSRWDNDGILRKWNSVFE